MIRHNEFLVFLREKNSKNLQIKDIILRSIGVVCVRVVIDPKPKGFSGSVYFEFGSKKSCLESKNFDGFESDF